MIEDGKLAKISLAVAISGLVVMLIAVNVIGPEEANAGELDFSDSGKQVAVNATVAQKRVTDGNLFLRLEDPTGNITAVIFERAARDMDLDGLETGSRVLAIGQVNTYKGELEIIVRKLVIEWKL